MKRVVRFLLSLSALFFSFYSYSQLSGGNAYLIGEHIEIGVDANGMEGTDDLVGTNSRGGTCPTSYFGFVSDAENDSWTNYSGDYFTPGVPENGFGLDLNGLEYGNNATACGGELYQIPGALVAYNETEDSITVDWSGIVAGVGVDIRYELQKDLYYFTTKVSLENLTGTTMSNLYYYRTMDPDNNQTIGWGYVTDNKIISQSGFSNDTVIVRATQVNAWESWVQFEAVGSQWRGYHGGFSNRDGSEMWSGLGFSVIEGSETTADAAIGLSYRIPTLASGAVEEFQFNVRFAEDTLTPEEPDPGIGFGEYSQEDLEVYPNPSSGVFTIQLAGAYDFIVSDGSGRIVSQGFAEDQNQLNLRHLSPGMYFLKVRQNGGKFRIKKLLLE